MMAPRLSMAAQLAAHRLATHLASPSTVLIPVPEHDLLRDIIYILQGIDGHWMRFPSSLPHAPVIINKDSQNNIETSFILFSSSSTHTISPPTRDLLHQLSELGHLFRTIDGALVLGKQHSIGMIEMSLHAALSDELVEYTRLITVLEDQLNQGTSGTDDDNSAGQGGLTLRKMLVWMEEMRLKLRMMAVLVADGLDERPTGGALLTFLHSYTTNGDPFIRKFSSRLLRVICVPFFTTLSAWIYEGELRDPFEEFFVAVNPILDGQDEMVDRLSDDAMEDFASVKVGGGELWEGKFVFRKELLPGFLEEDFGRKIYSTGKSLNFLKHSAKDAEWVAARDHIDGRNRILQYADIAGLEQSISLAYSAASQRLFDIFFEKFRLLDHLKALKNYLMLGKGDFVEILIENLGPSLSTPAHILYRHNLTATLEAAIKNSTASSDHPDTLQRLDARMLDFVHGEIGWDVFTLEYKIDSPLDTVLDEKSMQSYLVLFKHLWQIKRVEFSLNEIYARLMTGARTFLRVPALKHIFHTTRLAVSDFRFFITQLQAYCHSEVIDCSWRVLEEFIVKKARSDERGVERKGEEAGIGNAANDDGGCDLDSLIEQHRIYLDRLVSKTLLINGGKRGKGELLLKVREIFAIALRYREVVDSLCDYALSEAANQESTRDFDRGLTTPLRSHSQSQSYSKGHSSAQTDKLAAIDSRLTEYYAAFKSRTNEVVAALATANDLDMRFLGVRENYNAFYVKKKGEEEIQADKERRRELRLKAQALAQTST